MQAARTRVTSSGPDVDRVALGSPLNGALAWVIDRSPVDSSRRSAGRRIVVGVRGLFCHAARAMLLQRDRPDGRWR
jgi:hypothetical protein